MRFARNVNNRSRLEVMGEFKAHGLNISNPAHSKRNKQKAVRSFLSGNACATLTEVGRNGSGEPLHEQGKAGSGRIW